MGMLIGVSPWLPYCLPHGPVSTLTSLDSNFVFDFGRGDFQSLLRWLEHVVDRFVYRLDYDPALVQEETSLFLRSLDAAPALAQGFIERVCKPAGPDQ
jgi:hypothetical protein